MGEVLYKTFPLAETSSIPMEEVPFGTLTIESLPIRQSIVHRDESVFVGRPYSRSNVRYLIPVDGLRSLYEWVEPLHVYEALSVHPELVALLEHAAAVLPGFFPDLRRLELEPIADEDTEETSLLVTVVETGKTRDAVAHLDSFIRDWLVDHEGEAAPFLAFTARAE